MRILTVRQPFAHAIIHLGKHVENRPMNIAGDYRGEVAIHAGLAWEWERPEAWPADVEFPHPTSVSLEYGAIIGVANLWAVHPHDGSARFNCCPNAPDKYARWAQPNVWHLCFSSPRPLTRPIPFKGALGLRRLDADTTTRIKAAIA